MVCLVLDNDGLTEFMKQFKDHKETGVVTGKKKFDPVFEHISKKMAAIKRHFFGSPYEMMLEAAAENEKNKSGVKL